MFYLLIIVFLFGGGMVDISRGNDQDVFRASWTPETSKVQSGNSWSFYCYVSTNSSVIWYKHVGDLVTKIGSDVILNNKDYTTASIFLLNKEIESNVAAYSLQLIGARLEDSGVFQCVSSTQSSLSSAVPFIVCDDTSESYCDCMVSHKWANPLCFPQDDETTKDHKTFLTGLIIGLGVTSFYVIVITLIYGRDFIALLCKECKEKKKRKKATGQKNVSKAAAQPLHHMEYADTVQLDQKESTSLSEEDKGPSSSASSEGKSDTSGYSGSHSSGNDKLEGGNEKQFFKGNKKSMKDQNVNFSFEADLHTNNNMESNLTLQHHNSTPWSPPKPEKDSKISSVSENLKPSSLYPDLNSLATLV